MTTCQVFNKLPFIKFILQHFNKICSMVSKTVRSLYRYLYAGLVLPVRANSPVPLHHNSNTIKGFTTSPQNQTNTEPSI